MNREDASRYVINHSEKFIRDLEGPGFTIVEDILTAREIADFKLGLQQLEAESPQSAHRLGSYGGVRNLSIFRSKACRQPLLDPRIREIAALFLGPEPTVCSYQTHTLPPGAQGMGPHRDYPYFSLPTHAEAGAVPLLTVQFVWALDELREDNAPTLVEAGSHHYFTAVDPEPFDAHAQPLLLRAGSLAILHGALCHAVAPNTSDASRMALLASFSPYWIRPLQPSIGLPGSEESEVRNLLGLDFTERLRRATASFT